MPDNFNKCRSDYSKYDSMTTEELEDILRKDAENLEGETDVDFLMYIRGVIKEREKMDPNRKTPEEAFEIFKTHYMPTDSEMEDSLVCSEDKSSQENSAKVIPMPRWMRRLVSAAAVVAILIVCSATANALGYNIWEMVLQWTQETFYFVRDERPTPSAPDTENHLEYDSLQDALDKNKIAVPLAPKWFPDGYEMTQIKVNTTPAWDLYLAMYRNKEDQNIKVQIKWYLDSDPQQIERSSMLIEEYESNGVVYYIFEDNKQLRTVWVVENFECYISGELTLAELKAIVDSIKE